ncbi:MAG: hypothetical protein EZS28_012496 [Streblomastix strix]|uniref:DDE-1 domain-containing protein n=1 Tax=Streblomastix strix TaxID=222440 RepID=A0A5J4WBD7_9EUKA|nr:MAG: hypothetical protein EZS28_012496 [Streblomastix strix]
MSIQIPAIQQNTNNLKHFLQGKLASIDADIQFPVDRSEPRVSTIVALTLNSEMLPPFLITSQQFEEIQFLRNIEIQNQNATIVQSNTCMMNMQLMMRWIREILILYFKNVRKKNGLPAAAVGTFLTDNASSHFTQVVRDLLQANYLLLLTLPPNSTYILQPSDVEIFGSLKLAYQQGHAGKFTSLLFIVNSFRACAITTVVQNGKLIAQFFQESIDRVIKAIQVDNAAVPIPLMNPKRLRRASKFGPLNATSKK